MDLTARINDDLKAALKAKDPAALRALRALKSAFQLAETAEGRPQGPLTEAEALKVLAKQIKQRHDSVEQFRSNGREDLATSEEEELSVLKRYQPAMLSAEEVAREVSAIVADVGASTLKDMGRVMQAAQEKLAGRVDGKALSTAVKALLTGE